MEKERKKVLPHVEDRTLTVKPPRVANVALLLCRLLSALHSTIYPGHKDARVSALLMRGYRCPALLVCMRWVVLAYRSNAHNA